MIVQNKMFLETWEKYIEYLKKEYDVVLTPDQERIRINELNKISHADINVAISIVKITIERGEVNLIIN